MKTTLQVGLVGAGHISRFHHEALRRMRSVRVAAVCDPHPERRAAFATLSGAAPFESVTKMLDAGLDVVHVTTPPDSHAPIAIEALSRGAHVFVEKPLATSAEDCDRIAQAADARGRLVCVGHSLLWDPFVAKARSLIQSGRIGTVLHVDYVRNQPSPPYHGGLLPDYFKNGGFPFRDLGIHAFYIVEEFLGGLKHVDYHFRSTEAEPHLRFDQWVVRAECERGVGTIRLSWNVKPQQNVITIQGTHGIIRVDLFGMSVSVKRTGFLPEHVSRIWNALSEGSQISSQALFNAAAFARGRLRQYHGVQSLIADFYDAIQHGRPSPVPVEAAREVVRWTERVSTAADDAKDRWLAQWNQPLNAKVLITGSTGLIGTRLIERFLARHDKLRVLVRREPRPHLRENPRIEWVMGDLGDPVAVKRAVGGVDLVYHVGAAMRGGGDAFDRGTVAGTRNVVDAIVDGGRARLIFISSLSVLQVVGTGSEPLSETSPLENNPRDRGNYSRAKLAAESYVRTAVHERGLEAVILRPAEVVAPGKPLLTSGVGILLGRRLIILGRGNVRLPLVHVDDLIDAIELAAAARLPSGSLFHIVDPRVVTQNDLAKLAASEQKPLQVMHLPLPLIYTLVGAVQLAFRAIGRQSPVTTYRFKSALTPREFDGSRAASALGWMPRTTVDRYLKSFGDQRLALATGELSTSQSE